MASGEQNHPLPSLRSTGSQYIFYHLRIAYTTAGKKKRKVAFRQRLCSCLCKTIGEGEAGEKKKGKREEWEEGKEINEKDGKEIA